MSITSTTKALSQFTGDGTTTAFTLSWVFSQATDLTVYVTDLSNNITTKTLTTDYTVSGGGSPAATGTVTFVTAPASGYTVTIQRTTAQTQANTFTQNGKFPSVVIEGSLDKLTLEVQDLNTNMSLIPKMRPDSSVTNIQFAPPTAGYFLRWDPSTSNLISSLSPTAAAISAQIVGSLGLVAQTSISGSGTLAAVTITGGTGITVTNGNGVSGNPTIALSSSTQSTLSGAAQKSSNLSDLASASTARTNLGLGTAAVQAVSAFLQPSNNLSELTLPATARTNLGLGTAATLNTTGVLQPSNNLSEIISASAARTNLGLGTAAIHNTGDFMTSANNLSDVADSPTARTNLGLGNLAVKNVTDGTASQILQTDGKGGWTFVTPSAGTTYSAGTGLALGGTTFSIALSAGTGIGISGATITNNLAAGLIDTLAVGGNATAGLYKFFNSAKTFYVGLQAGTLSANVTWTLPTADGANGQVLTTNGSGVMSWTTVSGSASTTAITQTAHGFSVGNVLTLTGADTYAKAKADSAANAEVVGIVSAVADANNFTLQSGGRIATLSGLTANTVYFLDPSTAGALTATEPTTAGQVSKPLLITSSTTAGYIFIMRGLVVGTALTAAAQSDVVTGTSTTLFVTPSVLKYHPGVAKASVQWTVGGTTINYQNNVSSITRTAAGDYTVNFTSNLANTTDMRVYCNFISASTMLAPAVNTVAVGSARVQIRNTSGTLTDPSGNVWVDVFGTF